MIPNRVQFSPADLQDDELHHLCFELVARASVVPEARVERAGGGELEDDGERVGADADEGHDVRVPQVDQDVQLLLVARVAAGIVQCCREFSLYLPTDVQLTST